MDEKLPLLCVVDEKLPKLSVVDEIAYVIKTGEATSGQATAWIILQFDQVLKLWTTFQRIVRRASLEGNKQGGSVPLQACSSHLLPG